MPLLIAIGVFLGVVLVHAAVCRLNLPGNSVFRFLAIGTAVGLAFAMRLYRGPGTASETIAALLVYALSCELYLFLFTMTIGSISTNLLITLSRHDRTLAEIEQLYNSRSMVEKRITRLISAGLLVPEGTHLAVTARGERLTAFLTASRSFFRHPPQGS